MWIWFVARWDGSYETSDGVPTYREGVRSSVMIMATKKQWSDFSGGQRAAILVGSAIEVVLTTVALADLARRPRAQVRGPKSLWVLGCVVQPVGPIAYLALGRRSS
jgi:hypothetical protein